MRQSNFFENSQVKKSSSKRPLADLMRPATLEDYLGQDKLVGKEGPISRMIQKDDLVSMVLWGPPGSGKTTIASIIAKETSSYFVQLSAVSSGKQDVAKVIDEAKDVYQAYNGKRTILFLDEIHRFNKAQQDYLLPYVEDGTIILIGATTENPSFEVNSALLSRMRVFVLEKLRPEEIKKLLDRAVKYIFEETGLKIELNDKAKKMMSNLANGDMRNALNTLEVAIKIGVTHKSKKLLINHQLIKQAVQQSPLYYDKQGEEHYNLISALHKSMRASDANAALYWLARMLEAGEKPEYIARRMLRFASEDIGNAEPLAVILANSVFDSVHKIGLPECKVHLAQLVIFLSKAPKDNSAYIGYGKASQDAKSTLNLAVPLHLRNAPTEFMKDIGYGKGYIYDHDLKNKKSGQQCLPDELRDRDYLSSS